MNSKISTTYLKKGSPEDLLIELDENCQNLIFFQNFINFTMEENFLVNFTSLQNKNQIKFYLSSAKKKNTKRKNKNLESQTSPINIKKSEKVNVNRALVSIFTKYNTTDENREEIKKKENISKKEENIESKQRVISKEEKAENFVLKMNLLVIDKEIFSVIYEKKLEKIEENLDINKNPDLKHFILFEGVQHFFTSNNIKRKIQINLTVSPCLSEEEEDRFSEEKFNDWLCDLIVTCDYEYTLTETKKESLDYVKQMVESIILQKYKNLELNVFGKENTHTEKSKICGFDNEFALMWIDMLMGIPGISEDKAIAIAKNYHSFKNFMGMVNGTGAEEKLKNLQIYYNYDQSKSKKLGGALAAKLVKVFTEKDPIKLT